MDGNRVSLSPHVLLLPWPSQGHINPFMELGTRLSASGVRVTLATTQYVHTRIQAASLPQLPISDRHADFTLVGVADGLPDVFDRDHLSYDFVQAIDNNLEDRVFELVHTLASQGRAVTCIVADFFMLWSTSLAHRTGLPEFLFWPMHTSMLSILFHVDALISAGFNPFDISGTGRPDPMERVSCIPGLPHHVRYADLPFQSIMWEMSMGWNKKMMTHRFSHLGEAQGVIVNSFEALEPEMCKAFSGELQQLINSTSNTRDGSLARDNAVTSPSFLQLVGPLEPSRGASLREEKAEECMQWLDAQPPSSVVFVAFGSVATMSCIEQVQELARGLIASGQRFLWVLREDAIRPENPQDSIKSIGLEDALPHGFLEQTKHIGKVVRWAPQAKVLIHPSVGGFFSHCGWNSILETISAGVPVLGWPFFFDQFINCRLVSHVWKMGLALECNACTQTTRAHIENGVRQLMEGPHTHDMRTRALELKNLAHEAANSSSQFLSFVDNICTLPSTGSPFASQSQRDA